MRSPAEQRKGAAVAMTARLRAGDGEGGQLIELHGEAPPLKHVSPRWHALS
jgi:hypothetical protein